MPALSGGSERLDRTRGDRVQAPAAVVDDRDEFLNHLRRPIGEQMRRRPCGRFRIGHGGVEIAIWLAMRTSFSVLPVVTPPASTSDHTTVSRQLARLESLGLVRRVESADDRRTRRAVVTAEGKTMSERIDAARERMFGAIFRDWPPGEVSELTRLMAKFAVAMRERR